MGSVTFIMISFSFILLVFGCWQTHTCVSVNPTSHLPTLQGQDLGNQRRKRPAKRTSDHGRPSQQNSCKDSNRSFRQIGIWRSRGDRTWRRNWAWTNPRSRSGFRTRGPKSRRLAALKTLWPCTWWHRDCTITPPSRRKTKNQTAIDFQRSKSSLLTKKNL